MGSREFNFKLISCDRLKINIQYLSIFNFVILLKNGSSLHILIKSAVNPGQSDKKCSCLIKQEAYCVEKVISLKWPVCLAPLSATSKAVLIKSAMFWVVRFYQETIEKVHTLNITPLVSVSVLVINLPHKFSEHGLFLAPHLE